MEREEFLARCKDAVEKAGDKAPTIIAQMISGVMWDIREWNQSEDKNTDGIRDAVADAYIGLMMAQIFWNLPSNVIGDRIESQLMYQDK